MIFLQANAAKLIVTKRETLTAKSKKAFFVTFSFSPEWDGLTRTAIFSNGTTDGTRSVIFSGSGPVEIPWESLVTDGKRLTVGVLGIRGEEIVLPTIYADLGLINRGAQDAAPTEPPTPGEYAQIIGIMEQTQAIAQSVRDDADNGVFDGADGTDGVSVVGVEIRDSHLYCILSDGTEIDAGELPGSDGTYDHRELEHRDAEDSHPMSAITGLSSALSSKQDTISDLATIRTGAEKGETALQPSALNPYRTASEQNAIDGEQNTAISAIEGKIPSSASAQNQLVSSSQMSEAISAVEAKQLYKTAQQGSFATKAELLAAQTVYNADGTVATPTKNDVAYVLADESHDGKLAKYVIAATAPSIVWGFVIAISGTDFTQEQLDALNSGITNAKRTGYDSHVANGGIHVTASDKTSWNSKYSKPSSGIPKTDLSSGVQTSLGKADNSMPTSGGTFSGDITFATGKNVKWTSILGNSDPAYFTTFYNNNAANGLAHTSVEQAWTALLKNATGRLGSLITNNRVESCDNANENGFWYIGDSDAKRPSGVGVDGKTDYNVLAMIHSKNSNGSVQWGRQIATDFRTNRMWKRYCNNATWSAWELIAGASDIAGKQDTISDLATIRSGAAAGATAYQKPSSGIPASDLASAVRTSLGRADSALQSVPNTYRTAEAQDVIDAGKADKIPTITIGIEQIIGIDPMVTQLTPAQADIMDSKPDVLFLDVSQIAGTKIRVQFAWENEDSRVYSYFATYEGSYPGLMFSTFVYDAFLKTVTSYQGAGTLYTYGLDHQAYGYSVFGFGRSGIPQEFSIGSGLKLEDGELSSYAHSISTILSTATINVGLTNNDTIVLGGTPTSLTVTLPAPDASYDYLTGIIFKAGASMTFSDTAPTGYAIKWDSNPTWTSGKVYEIIYRCLWLTDGNGNVIISAKWSEV